MKEFPSFKDVKLTRTKLDKLKQHFKWSHFSEGQTKTNITPTGGIHFSGKLTLTKSITFEIKRGNTYVMINLFEYPKGIVFHPYVQIPLGLKKGEAYWMSIFKKIYNEIKEIVEK